jgi:hypothetical protein
VTCANPAIQHGIEITRTYAEIVEVGEHVITWEALATLSVENPLPGTNGGPPPRGGRGGFAREFLAHLVERGDIALAPREPIVAAVRADDLDWISRHEITWHDYETGITHQKGDPILNPRTGRPYTRPRRDRAVARAK